jgi:hypothetical protein
MKLAKEDFIVMKVMKLYSQDSNPDLLPSRLPGLSALVAEISARISMSRKSILLPFRAVSSPELRPHSSQWTPPHKIRAIAAKAKLEANN